METREDLEKWASCVAGAEERDVYSARLARAGFVDIEITEELPASTEDNETAQVASVRVVARKPR